MRVELCIAALCVAGLALDAALAVRVRPDLTAPVALTRGQQERLEEVASASLFGQFRSNFADFLWLKADKYLHSGIDMRGMTAEERRSATTLRVGHGTGAHDGNREHGAETTLVPAAAQDWRGRLGDVERDVKPFADMSHHGHRDPKEALPLFRLMTWSNPHFVQGYSVGAVMIAREKKAYHEALEFLAEGLRNNPESIEIEATFAFLLLKGRWNGGARYDEALAHAEAGLRCAARKDPKTLTEDERQSWQDSVRWRVLSLRELGRTEDARQAAREGLALFPGDTTCRLMLRDVR